MAPIVSDMLLSSIVNDGLSGVNSAAKQDLAPLPLSSRISGAAFPRQTRHVNDQTQSYEGQREAGCCQPVTCGKHQLRPCRNPSFGLDGADGDAHVPTKDLHTVNVLDEHCLCHVYSVNKPLTPQGRLIWDRRCDHWIRSTKRTEHTHEERSNSCVRFEGI